MRLAALIGLVFGLFPVFSQDSTGSRHYQVRLCLQNSYRLTAFHFLNISQERTFTSHSSSEAYARYDGQVTCGNFLNPELVCDVRFPSGLKLTGGTAYQRVSFSIRTPRYQNWTYQLYAPGSSPISNTITGMASGSELVGNHHDAMQFDWISVYSGLGFSKSYKRMIFEIDDALTFNKVVRATSVREIDDQKNGRKSVQNYEWMTDQRKNDAWPFLMNQLNVGVSYRLTSHLQLKAGLKYSRAFQNLIDDTYQHYSEFSALSSYGFLLGIALCPASL